MTGGRRRRGLRGRAGAPAARPLLPARGSAADRALLATLSTRDGLVTRATTGFLEATGHDLAALRAGGHRLLSSGLHPPAFFAELWATVLAGEPWRGAIRNRRRDGSCFWLDQTIVPLRGRRGDVRGFLAVGLDVTARMEALEATAARADAATRLLRGAAAGLAVVDREDRVVVATEALAAMMEAAPGALPGRTLAELGLAEAPAPRGQPLDRRVGLPSGRALLSRAVVEAPQGNGLAVATVVDRGGPLGRPDDAAGRAALAELGEIASMIAHEVKNPLAGVGGVLRVIGDRMPAGSQERGILEEVQARLLTLNSTLDELLLFARPIEPREERLELGPLLDEALARARRAPAVRDLEVEVEGEALAVIGDRDLLRRLLGNLLLHAGQSQGGQGRVAITLGRRGGTAQLRVEDQGPRIPPEVRDQLFDPLVTRRTHGGSLALPVARRIAEAHDGRVTLLDAAPGLAGNAVLVELPLAP